jgi:predicted RNA-binding Zn-ribbon protein involved in translation (DUF1610 family)
MKRKYTKSGENPIAYKCTKQKCGWEGIMEEKELIDINAIMSEYVCPKCGNNEFRGLLQLPMRLLDAKDLRMLTENLN